jgi:proteasome activator subunit 4
MLKCAVPKDIRIKLAKVYLHVCTTPGMPARLVAKCADTFQALIKSKKKLSIDDMRLPWKPIYDLLSEDLFLTRRQFEYTYDSKSLSSVFFDGTDLQAIVVVYGLSR